MPAIKRPRHGKQIPSPAKSRTASGFIDAGITTSLVWPCMTSNSFPKTWRSRPKLYNVVAVVKHLVMFSLFVKAFLIGFCDVSTKSSSTGDVSPVAWILVAPAGPKYCKSARSRQHCTRGVIIMPVNLRSGKVVHGFKSWGIFSSSLIFMFCSIHCGMTLPYPEEAASGLSCQQDATTPKQNARQSYRWKLFGNSSGNWSMIKIQFKHFTEKPVCGKNPPLALFSLVPETPNCGWRGFRLNSCRQNDQKKLKKKSCRKNGPKKAQKKLIPKLKKNSKKIQSKTQKNAKNSRFF